MGYDQTYACCERESRENRRNAFEVHKVFAFASPHICVLCVVGDTFLPQTSCSGGVVCEGLCLLVYVFVRVGLSSNTHICILYISVKKKKKIAAAVTMFCRKAKTRRCRDVGVGEVVVCCCLVCLCDTDKI